MSDLVAYEPGQHNEVVARNQALLDLRDRIFRQGLHYGEPFKGSGKPTLLKPGAELILARFKLWPEFIDRGVTERWDSEPPIFHYRYECRLRHRVTNEVWGAGIGSCNSLEDKYRWRKQDRLCPNCGAPKIIRSKYPDKRTGEFGWYCLSCKTPFPPGHEAIEDQPVGRVPNDEIFTLINTLDKMAQKRALVAAVLVATGASTFFTQDVEDFPGYAGEIIDGEFASPDGETEQEQAAMPESTKSSPFPSRKSQRRIPDAARETPPASELDEAFPRGDQDDKKFEVKNAQALVHYVGDKSDDIDTDKKGWRFHAGKRAMKALGVSEWKELVGRDKAEMLSILDNYIAEKNAAAQTDE